MTDSNELGEFWSRPADEQERAFKLLRQDRQRYNATHGHIAYGANRHHSAFAQIKADEILFRAGILQRAELHRDAAPEEFTSAVRLCRDFISLAGGTPPPINQPIDIVNRALGSSDFPYLLENLSSKAVSLGFFQAPEIWPLITKTTPTKNFLEFSRITKAELPAPPEVGEHGELTQAQIGAESAERATAKSYAQLMRISREAIINDSLAEVAVTFFEAGRSVSRAIGDAVFSILTTNGAMADTYNLFSTEHANIGSTSAAPSIATLDELVAIMMAQTGPTGEVLNIRPHYIVAAATLESTMAVLRNAMNANDPTDESTGKIVTLTDGRLTGAPWYVIGQSAACIPASRSWFRTPDPRCDLSADRTLAPMQ